MALLGYIQVTRKCNQKCKFCSNPPIEAELSIEKGIKLVDDLIKRGYDGVIFTGGEPTISPILSDLIRYAIKKKIEPRIVTNGQLIGMGEISLEKLYQSGLKHIHISIYSHKPDVVSFLTGKEDSFDNFASCMKKLEKLHPKITVDINVVINHYNADHLDSLVKYLIQNFPFIHHFVFNNLDPFMNRVAENPDTIPALWEFELSLKRALEFLEKTGKTFRVERVPLCYMAEFACASTETRKIVKGEDRVTHFLDEKGTVHQTSFIHKKAECCKVCLYDSICAGLDGVGHGFHLEELYPLFLDPAPVIAKIKRGD